MRPCPAWGQALERRIRLALSASVPLDTTNPRLVRERKAAGIRDGGSMDAVGRLQWADDRDRPLRIVALAEGHFRDRMKARALAVAWLALFVLGFAVTDSSALPRVAAPSGEASAPFCQGKARRVRPGHISFSFSCGGEDVTAFDLKANRALHSVYDPSYAFGCERRTSRSFSCEDIHSGSGPEGFGVVTVSEPLCHPSAHLVLRIIPTLDFEARSHPAFTLRGPC
jgi:hypothetical protein